MDVDLLVSGKVIEAVTQRLASAFRLWRLDELDADPALAGRIRGVVSGQADAALIGRLPALELIAHFGVGYDSVDARAAAARGVVVTHTPDVLTEEVADTAIGLLIMTVRELAAAERWVRDGRWLREGMYPLTPGSLRGRTLGILGAGRIGQAIGRRAEAFGLAVHYHSRRPLPGTDWPYWPTPLALAEAVDTLMVVLPGSAQTRHLVDRRLIEALGPGGVLINIGRGSVVDEAALARALHDGTLLAAGLDVFEQEPQVHPDLLSAPRTVLLPHVGSASIATRQAMADLQVANVEAWFAGRPALTPVPETPSPADRAAVASTSTS